FSPSGDLLATANDGSTVSILKYESAAGRVTHATVSRSLAVRGRAASISALLRSGRARLPVTAPAAGREQIVWQYKLRRPWHGQRSEVVVASGSKTFKAPERTSSSSTSLGSGARC
ncbi:MAG: hypothetical protein ACRDNJ_16010, partial [Solirubrobacteraceae bacterium]